MPNATARLRAIIFDFNGVIADDEAPHFLAFQQALAENGIGLSKEDYYGTYLGMDERNCLVALMKSRRGKLNREDPERILTRKAELFRRYTTTCKPDLFPGVAEFVLAAGHRYRLAIASGGRREQIEWALRGNPIAHLCAVVVSAEDTTLGKPEPQIYQVALERMNGTDPAVVPLIRPEECLVIEDSKAGIQAARRAGMKVVALATTYPAEHLTEADSVLRNWGEVSFERLEGLFR